MGAILKIIVMLELFHTPYSISLPTEMQFQAQVELEAHQYSLVLKDTSLVERSICQSKNLLVINFGYLNSTRATGYMVWGSAGPLLAIYAIREGGLHKIADDQGEESFEQICSHIEKISI